MSVVHKYPLAIDVSQDVSMPHSAEVIHVDVQAGTVTLWAHVHGDPTHQGQRRFLIFGTGHQVDVPIGYDRIEHRGTVLMQSGTLVLHVFEALEEPPF